MPDTYLKLNDGLPEHRKIVAAGGDAGWLHVCALAYASRNLTDGRIPAGMVPRLSDRKQPAKLAAKLIAVNLWHTSGHGCPRCPQPGPDEYVIHDYLIHQRSAAKVDEIKTKRAIAGRSGGTRKAANAKTGAKPKGKQTPSNLLDGWHDPVAANATPDTEEVLRTSRAEEPLRGSQAEAEQVPPSAGASAPSAEVTAGAILGQWLRGCRKRPPDQVIGQLGKIVKDLLGQGIDPSDVTAGVEAWAIKSIHPAALPSVVNEVMNAAPARSPSQSRNTQIVDAAMERAIAAEQRMQNGDTPDNVLRLEITQ